MGQQLALKIFSKGEKLEKVKDIIDGQEVFVLARNSQGEEQKFLKRIYDTQKDFSAPLKELVQLEEKKEEKMEIGYYQDSVPESVAEVNFKEKEYFQTEDEPTLEERLEEDFDESRAEEIKIVGKFVDYHGLAYKYHFSFQARKNQDKIGKQKILCIVDNEMISEIIDLLKPENQVKNVCIFGKATKYKDEKIDKIKIYWTNDNENYDPNQKQLL